MYTLAMYNFWVSINSAFMAFEQTREKLGVFRISDEQLNREIVLYSRLTVAAAGKLQLLRDAFTIEPVVMRDLRTGEATRRTVTITAKPEAHPELFSLPSNPSIKQYGWALYCLQTELNAYGARTALLESVRKLRTGKMTTRKVDSQDANVGVA